MIVKDINHKHQDKSLQSSAITKTLENYDIQIYKQKMLTIFELKQTATSWMKTIQNIEQIIHIKDKKQRLLEIENQISNTTDWTDIKLYA